mmetsp:Transcript_36530/g.84994  ORF Transcript_36530/g.84994 Transcript_36530/m.84994 type:complete len:248 (+) Transcript_36530:186-929(+)
MELHPESILRVDSCPRAGSHVLRVSCGRGKLKGEFAQDHGQGCCAFQHGKDITHALSRSCTEWNEGIIRRKLVRVEGPLPLGRVKTCPSRHLGVLVRPLEALRIESVRVWPVLFVAVNVVDRDEKVHAPEHLGLLAGGSRRQCVLLKRTADQQWRLGVHPERLSKTKPYELHLLDILVRGALLAIKDRLNLLLNPGQELGVLSELKEGPGQRGSCGLVPRNQHCDHVVAQLLPGGCFSAHVNQKAEQ